jgi:hypothetical protein
MAISFMLIPDYLGGRITELIILILSIVLIIGYNLFKKAHKKNLPRKLNRN